MSEDDLTINEVIIVCSKVKLSNGTLSFDSYGSNEFRRSTTEFLQKHQLLHIDAERMINALNEKDLYKGPIEHYNKERKHRLWIFKKKYKSLKVYIKLMVYKKGRCVAVISLHDWYE